MKEKTRTILYGTFVCIMVLFLYIAYANVTTELKIEGEGEAKEQEGVYIANVEYLTNNGADTTSSEINYYIGTMLDSKIVLGSSTSSSITYQVTIKNNTDREQVFIGIVKDETNEQAYNNTSIQPNVETIEEVTGIEAGKTVIAPGEYLVFPVTYAYAGTDTSNNELQGKINFRFRELPIVELSNEGETYTLEDVSPGYEKEIEFTVSNYNENYTNGVPLTYVIEPEFTEGCPLTAKIYDSEGNEVTESITMAGDNNTHEDHTYTLKLTWDSSITGEEYLGQEYTCNVKVTATPDKTVNAELAKYGEYSIEEEFRVDITTLTVIPISTAEQLLKIGSNEVVTINGTNYTFSTDANYELQNDITFEIDEYIDEYPDAFKGEITTIENETTNYETANSEENLYYTYTAPATGTYKLEVWGANGGSYNTSYATGGVGGYSVGIITLAQGDKIYVYVGGAGSYSTTTTYTSTSAGGYNGGGNVGYRGGSGGGGTDIRIGGTTLYDRVIAAGGGGGAFSYNSIYKANGGNGGGITGNDGSTYDSSYTAFAGKGGNQTAGGAAGTGSSTNYNGTAGSFGTGGKTGYKYNSTWYYSNGAGGGGWYGGGGAGNYSSSNSLRANGGGGGSGYVWTSSTASNVPSGYNVGTEYYLADAGTYGSGETSFVSNPNTDGNGYTRITLLTGTKDLRVWIDVDTQIVNGTLTGEFDYNGYTITVGDITYPTIPTLDVEVSDITETGAKITATGKDAGGDELEYTLQIGGKTYGPSTTIVWELELTDNTIYIYTVEVTDGKYTASVTGAFTTPCIHNYEYVISTEPTCTTCGEGYEKCTKCGDSLESEHLSAIGHVFENNKCTICGTARNIVADGSWDGNINTPILTDDMMPVGYTTCGCPINVATNEEWYNYVAQASGTTNTSLWANAKTSDGSYWVWIPRYEYKITSTASSLYAAGTIDVNFIPITTNSSTSGYTTTTAVNSTVNGVTVLSKGITVSSDGYIIHPAFTSDPDIGGWDSELAGIWVAKYEMSREDSSDSGVTWSQTTTTGNVSTGSTIRMVSKPGVQSWRYINISNCYENSLKYDTDKNSHLMKNSEWGAVAYLTHSKYGRNGKEVTINTSSSYYTAGKSGATATTNVAQSSTGNATGIYDLSGCAYEYVAAFNDAYSSSGSYYSKTSSSYASASGNNMGATGLANGGSTKYLTAYSNGTDHEEMDEDSEDENTSYSDFSANGYTVSITGDAISEVWYSTYHSWFGDNSQFVSITYPFFQRGGYYYNAYEIGVFSSFYHVGQSSSNRSFRVCLSL